MPSSSLNCADDDAALGLEAAMTRRAPPARGYFKLAGGAPFLRQRNIVSNVSWAKRKSSVAPETAPPHASVAFALRQLLSRSTTLVPQFEERPKILVTSRSSASADLTEHVRRSNRYKPQWSASNYVRDARDFAPYESNWHVRNRFLNPKHWPNGYLTPLYWPRDSVKHLDYYSEGVPNPYYPKGYTRNYFDNTYDRFLNDPYSVQDSENRAVARGLQLYRDGLIKYSSLDRYWLTPGYWDRRQRNWQDLYAWDYDRAYIPHNLEKRTQSYFSY
uniref:Uncharacterized protein n=1 Tax=Plectus sambesii TaxID=2011161 RepID=A0A914VXC2_9BILA